MCFVVVTENLKNKCHPSKQKRLSLLLKAMIFKNFSKVISCKICFVFVVTENLKNKGHPSKQKKTVIIAKSHGFYICSLTDNTFYNIYCLHIKGQVFAIISKSCLKLLQKTNIL